VARSVCFGAVDHGLPDPAGWMVLVLGPLSFLIVGFVALPRELKRFFMVLCSTRGGRVLLGLVLVAVLLESHWVFRKIEMAARYENFNYDNTSQEDLPTSYPRAGKSAPAFQLVDQTGQSFQLSNYPQDTILLTFAFAHCESVCPVLVRQVLEVGKSLKEKVRVVVLTLDPRRDTPKSLPYLARDWEFHEKAHLLSGAVDRVEAALRDFDVSYQRDERTGDVVHPALVYVLAPGGRIVYRFNNAPQKWLKQAAQLIVSENDSHFSAAR